MKQLTCSVWAHQGNARIAVHTQLQVPVQVVLWLAGVGEAHLHGHQGRRKNMSRVFK